MLEDPKSIRTQSSRQYHFTLLGSLSIKAAQKTLMKLTPVVDFIKGFRNTNIIHKRKVSFANTVKPTNMITLSQTRDDNMNQMITISG